MRYTIFDTPILNSVLRWQSQFLLKIFGWKKEGQLPGEPKYVVIAAPHTTNWELPIALLLAFAFRVRVCWMGKDSLFKWPFGAFFKWLGGIPVDRSKSHGLVEQSIQAFNNSEEMVMIMAPEGTRSRASHWRSGFYHIANGAHIPIALGFVDFRRKAGGVGPIVYPTGDIDTDMKVIRAFYDTITGKHPEQSSQNTITAKSC